MRCISSVCVILLVAACGVNTQAPPPLPTPGALPAPSVGSPLRVLLRLDRSASLRKRYAAIEACPAASLATSWGTNPATTSWRRKPPMGIKSRPAPLNPSKSVGLAMDPCSRQARAVAAAVAMNPASKDATFEQLQKQLEAHNAFVKGSSPEAAKLKCSNITVELLAGTAMGWHLEAVGFRGVRGTGDSKTMQLAAQLYDTVVKTFTQEDFAKFEFPSIIKEDWPTIRKIKYAMADLLYFQKDWRSAARPSTPSSPRTRTDRWPPRRPTPR